MLSGQNQDSKTGRRSKRSKHGNFRILSVEKPLSDRSDRSDHPSRDKHQSQFIQSVSEKSSDPILLHCEGYLGITALLGGDLPLYSALFLL
ncbi:hypothetical protein MHYP_G00061580 [Metynnis hypsauchen]